MYTEGIEWVIPIYLTVLLLFSISGFVALWRRVRQDLMTKKRAFISYFGVLVLPILLYVVFIFGIIGLEEIIEVAIFTEMLARTFLILIGIGLFVLFISSVVFLSSLLLIKK